MCTSERTPSPEITETGWDLQPCHHAAGWLVLLHFVFSKTLTLSRLLGGSRISWTPAGDEDGVKGWMWHRKLLHGVVWSVSCRGDGAGASTNQITLFCILPNTPSEFSSTLLSQQPDDSPPFCKERVNQVTGRRRPGTRTGAGACWLKPPLPPASKGQVCGSFPPPRRRRRVFPCWCSTAETRCPLLLRLGGI